MWNNGLSKTILFRSYATSMISWNRIMEKLHDNASPCRNTYFPRPRFYLEALESPCYTFYQRIQNLRQDSSVYLRFCGFLSSPYPPWLVLRYIFCGKRYFLKNYSMVAFKTKSQMWGLRRILLFLLLNAHGRCMTATIERRKILHYLLQPKPSLCNHLAIFQALCFWIENEIDPIRKGEDTSNQWKSS